MNCLCGAPDWSFAIRDCADAGCPPGYMPTVTNAVVAMCASKCPNRVFGTKQWLTLNSSRHTSSWCPNSRRADLRGTLSPINN
jgi:hypothetical protein